jgi:hypothetical protein
MSDVMDPPNKMKNLFSHCSTNLTIITSTQRFGSPAAGTGKTRRLEITFSGKWSPHTRAEGGQVEPVLGALGIKRNFL